LIVGERYILIRWITHLKSSPLKASTGITGLAVHPDPLPELLSTYKSTLSVISTFPQESVYRQATEALLKHRTAIVEKAAGDVAAVEKELDAGQIEQVLDVAKDELQLAGKMFEWKP
jgi:NADH dehydrogenase (ubiquinone) 1 alpha subcomplex subunit 5